MTLTLQALAVSGCIFPVSSARPSVLCVLHADGWADPKASADAESPVLGLGCEYSLMAGTPPGGGWWLLEIATH